MSINDIVHELATSGKLQGVVEGEDYCVFHYSPTKYSVHRPLKALELRALLSGIDDKDQGRSLLATEMAAIQTCLYPASIEDRKALFDRYALSTLSLQGKLIAMAGGEEYTDPKAESSPIA